MAHELHASGSPRPRDEALRAARSTGRTRLSGPPKLRAIDQQLDQSVMGIDAATFRNLALTQGADGGRTGSLLSDVDRTVSAAGGRMLAAHLSAPLTEIDRINARLEPPRRALPHRTLTPPRRARRDHRHRAPGRALDRA